MATDDAGLPPHVALPRHARVVLFGDFLSPLQDIQAAIGRLAAIPVGGYLLQILDPAEADLPYAGRIRFRGLEREGDTLIPRVEGVRGEYGRRLKAQQEGLAAICSAAAFGFADPPHRSFAGSGVARALYGSDCPMMAGSRPAMTAEGRACARDYA